MKVRKDWNFKCVQAVILWKTERSARDIAEIVGFSKSGAQCAIVRFDQRGNYNDNEPTGRPKLLTERDLRVLKRLTIGTARESSRELAIQLSEATEKIGFAGTVRRN